MKKYISSYTIIVFVKYSSTIFVTEITLSSVIGDHFFFYFSEHYFLKVKTFFYLQ